MEIFRQAHQPVRIESIGFGEAITQNTMEKMKKIINDSIKNYYVRRWAEKITETSSDYDDYGKVESIYDFLIHNTKYLKDPYGLELLKTPDIPLKLLDIGETPSLDCIPTDQKIIVRNINTAYYELIKIGELKDSYSNYEALSYNFNDNRFEFKPILQWIDKGEDEVFKVTLNNGTYFECTKNHLLFTLEGQKRKNIYETRLSEIDISRYWKRRILKAYKIPSLGLCYDLDKLWLSGMYVADLSQVFIANDDPELKREIADRLNKINCDFYVSKRTRHSYIGIKEKYKYNRDPLTSRFNGGVFKDPNHFANELRSMGRKSIDKKFPNKYLSLSEKCIEALLDGYACGDAYIPKKGSSWFGKLRCIYNTISDHLSEQLYFLHLVLGRPLYVQYQKNHMGAGRNPIWRLYDRITTMKKIVSREYVNGLGVNTIHSIESVGFKKKICDITVKDNHNFLLSNGVLVHNCDDYTVLSLSLLKSIGYPVAMRATSYNPDKVFSHIYGLVKIKGYGWIPFDVVMGKKGMPLGSEPPGATRVFDMEV